MSCRVAEDPSDEPTREFWRQRGTLGKVVIVVVAAVVVFSIIGAFTSGSDDGGNGNTVATETETSETETETETTTTDELAAGDPMTCLEDAGLSSVEERDTDLWRGFHDGRFTRS